MQVEMIHKIYYHYISVMVALKHNFEIVPKYSYYNKAMKETMNGNNGYGKPHKEWENFQIHYLWKDIYIESFDEFMITKREGYHGNFGYLGWYERFEDEICKPN